MQDCGLGIFSVWREDIPKAARDGSKVSFKVFRDFDVVMGVFVSYVITETAGDSPGFTELRYG